MTNTEMIKKIDELQEFEQFMEELKAEAEAIRDSIKAEMVERDTEEINLGKYIARWTSCLSSRFDTRRFKTNFGEEVYKAYCKEVSSRRFSIA